MASARDLTGLAVISLLAAGAGVWLLLNSTGRANVFGDRFRGMELTRVVRMGDAGDGVIDSEGIAYAETDDELFVVHWSSEDRVQVFDKRSGGFVRSIGRKGEGPGELLRAAAVDIGPEGDLWVYDRGNKRISVFSLEGDLLRSYRTPWERGTSEFHVLSDGSVIVNALVPSRDRIGLWLHRWTPATGRFVWSLPDAREGYVGDIPSRPFAVGARKDVWVAHTRWEYRIEHFAGNGTRIGHMLPVRRWFDQWKAEEAGQEDDGHPTVRLLPPIAQILDVAIWGDQLMIAALTGDPAHPTAQEQGFLNWGKRFDTVIEVFDAKSHELLVSEQIDLENGVVLGFLDRRRVLVLETTQILNYLSIWELSFNGQEAQPGG